MSVIKEAIQKAKEVRAASLRHARKSLNENLNDVVAADGDLDNDEYPGEDYVDSEFEENTDTDTDVTDPVVDPVDGDDEPVHEDDDDMTDDDSDLDFEDIDVDDIVDDLESDNVTTDDDFGDEYEESYENMDTDEDDDFSDLDDVDVDEIFDEVETELNQEIKNESTYKNTIKNLYKELNKTNKKLVETSKAYKILKNELNEVSLMNQKLFHINKLFNNFALKREQKESIIDKFDLAESNKEVKFVYGSLVESLRMGGFRKSSNNISEGKNTRSEKTRVTTKLNEQREDTNKKGLFTEDVRGYFTEKLKTR